MQCSARRFSRFTERRTNDAATPVSPTAATLETGHGELQFRVAFTLVRPGPCNPSDTMASQIRMPPSPPEPPYGHGKRVGGTPHEFKSRILLHCSHLAIRRRSPQRAAETFDVEIAVPWFEPRSRETILRSSQPSRPCRESHKERAMPLGRPTRRGQRP